MAFTAWQSFSVASAPIVRAADPAPFQNSVSEVVKLGDHSQTTQADSQLAAGITHAVSSISKVRGFDHGFPRIQSGS